MALSSATLDALRCPACHGGLERTGDGYACRNSRCGAEFPTYHDIPILIDERTSLFSATKILEQHSQNANSRRRGHVGAAMLRLLPDIDANVACRANYRRLGELLMREQQPRELISDTRPRVLIVGGATKGHGVDILLANDSLEVIETDVTLGPRTGLVCDAHNIPFADASMDAVVAQAVLEHVLDPNQCVREVHRVLKDGGLLYAEVPFMQQMHSKPYDFTRWTVAGVRNLLRDFEEADCGVACGPGMALAWACRGFALSCVSSRLGRCLAVAFSHITMFPLKYLDYVLRRNPGAVDSASALYCLGKKGTRRRATETLVGIQ